MNATIAGLTWRSLFGRRRAALLLVLPAVLLLLAVALRLLAGRDDSTTVALLGVLALGTLVPLLGLIAGTGSIGPEIDDGSIVYLLAKPVDRHVVVLSKLAVALLAVAGFAALPTFLAGLLMSGLDAGLAVGYGVGALVGGVAYCTLFLLLAVITRNAVVVGLLYALVWESAVGTFVPGARALSVQQWSLSITERIVGGEALGLGIDPAVSLPVGVTLIAVVSVAATWFAGVRLRSIRLTGEE